MKHFLSLTFFSLIITGALAHEKAPMAIQQFSPLESTLHSIAHNKNHHSKEYNADKKTALKLLTDLLLTPEGKKEFKELYINTNLCLQPKQRRRDDMLALFNKAKKIHSDEKKARQAETKDTYSHTAGIDWAATHDVVNVMEEVAEAAKYATNNTPSDQGSDHSFQNIDDQDLSDEDWLEL